MYKQTFDYEISLWHLGIGNLGVGPSELLGSIGGWVSASRERVLDLSWLWCLRVPVHIYSTSEDSFYGLHLWETPIPSTHLIIFCKYITKDTRFVKYT